MKSTVSLPVAPTSKTAKSATPTGPLGRQALSRSMVLTVQRVGRRYNDDDNHEDKVPVGPYVEHD